MTTSPATTPLTYNGYVTQVATMAIVNTTTSSGVVVGVDAAFNAIIPQMLNYAELRIQRDLDLFPAISSNTSYTLTAGSNLLTLSINDFVTLQTISIVSGGAIYPLLPVSKQVLQNVYGDTAYTAMPAYFAPYGGDAATYGNTSQIYIVGPYPDQSYPVTLTGLVRMQTLAVNATTALANTGTTFISTYLPDMLLQASMIYISQFQRNFGPASNDPQMGPTYEAQYQTLLKGAQGEEYRKKFEAAAWSSNSISPVATPTRG